MSSRSTRSKEAALLALGSRQQHDPAGVVLDDDDDDDEGSPSHALVVSSTREPSSTIPRTPSPHAHEESSSSSTSSSVQLSLEDILTQEQQTCIEIRDLCGWVVKRARAALPDGCAPEFVGELREKAHEFVRLVSAMDALVAKKTSCGTPEELQNWYNKRTSQVNRPRRFRNPKKLAAPIKGPSPADSMEDLMTDLPRRSISASTSTSTSTSTVATTSTPTSPTDTTPLPHALTTTTTSSTSRSAPLYSSTPQHANRTCSTCGVAQSPEWRKGPNGPATLCNACGLHYAKLLRGSGGMTAPSTPKITPAASLSIPPQMSSPPMPPTHMSSSSPLTPPLYLRPYTSPHMSLPSYPHPPHH
eukprot:TRINITY_DN1520_c3_g1_i5.p1 TRINITY_DN1520_c3_g1~~TRINITY_DN1520_c3_g1_i5.p1  ORF type:complete len:385 (+),score=100.93 TRINITY_DN1520_c3_g1_i5:79-1155(+)